ncbi:MAG: PepSY-like domain-containing protein [Alistipes sp.]|nr:hypothetical protein [Rikenellaceae bacterium]MBQ3148115.1 PepSY-like domain-containing protein [Alistipes sp.]MBQ4126846.1 PepSY-like domain-containing protein [Alistipes sp.]
MKRLFLSVCAVCVMTSCAEIIDLDSQDVTTEMAQAIFESKFPGASDIGWDNRLGYFVVDFTYDAGHEEPTKFVAWFDVTGNWYLTEEGFDYNDLPKSVVDAFLGNKDFLDCRILDVAMLERPDATAEYVMLVEGKVYGFEQRASLYYREDGVLHISIVEPKSDYTYGDYLLPPICNKTNGANNAAAN